MLAEDTGVCCLDIFSLFAFPCVSETSRYMLKYCLSGALNVKQIGNEFYGFNGTSAKRGYHVEDASKHYVWYAYGRSLTDTVFGTTDLGFHYFQCPFYETLRIKTISKGSVRLYNYWKNRVGGCGCWV